ncbi:MAG: DNA polymerase III subunit gamma/tau [Phycisphaerae bacterium]|nr:DNA polymerase III subunit gamma/tau [Phycisphaerae bacterium]
MADYLVLARKYRSETFDQVVGQEPIARTLVHAIESSRVAHAYLFTGTRGVGKTTMARILAKALNCLSVDAPTPNPCNRCDACRSIARGDDIDVAEIDGASNRGIDEIRQLRANAILRPARSRYRLYYIDEVHMLTREAFNALLKTLEEPPGHVKFIFATTEPEKVPPTILSRCQRFDFRNIPTRKIAEHLAAICKAEAVHADADALFRIARAASGSMRDGLSLLDQLLAGGGAVSDAEAVRLLGVPADERTIAIARAIADGSAASALAELAGVLDSGVTLVSAAHAIGDAFRHMMLISTCGADSDLVELADTQRHEVAELTKRFSLPALVQAVGILATLARNLRTSSLARPLLEAGLVRLAEADKFIDPDSLIERLEALSTARPVARPAAAASSPKPAAPIPSTQASPQQRIAPPAPAAEAAPPALQWEVPWLAANWALVVQALMGSRQMQVAGLIAPAKPTAFADGVLTLAFDASHETLRSRCAAQMDGAIAAALSALAGRQITCRYQAVGAGEHAAPNRPVFGGLSTAEKNAVGKDPSVQAVMGLFGGEVVDIRKDNAQPAGPEES